MSDAETMSIVLEVGEMSFDGNIIPQSWFEHLKYPSGKPHLTAIMILSEIVYWYRPREIRDERTGRTIRYEKKFKGDALQRSYESFGQQFGFNKREATDAVKFLAAEGIIGVELRTVVLEDNFKFPNVTFITVNPDRLREITYNRHQGVPAKRKGSSVETEGVFRSNGGPSSVQTEHPLRSNGTPSSAETEDPLRANGTRVSGETEELFRLDGDSSSAETETPLPAKRNTNIESNTESYLEREGEGAAAPPPPPEDSIPVSDHPLPLALRSEGAARRFPHTVTLATWCYRKLARPAFAPLLDEETLLAFEEALERLDGVARPCGQSAEDVITTRVWLKPEVQQALREAIWPCDVLSRQVMFALEDYSARAVRMKPPPATTTAPPPSRRRGNERPAWMTEDEWNFHRGGER